MSIPISDSNRVRLVTGYSGYFSGPASILGSHRGIMFPNQPSITTMQSVNYNTYDLVHTNYSFSAYRNTPSPTIQVVGEFTQTTFEEHQYFLGVLHFLRSVTKMFYGRGQISPTAGTPPPVLRFFAFGPQIFNNVPVILRSFSTTFDNTVDLKSNGQNALPAAQVLSVELEVQQSPDRQKNQFTTSAFISGNAYSNGFI